MPTRGGWSWQAELLPWRSCHEYILHAARCLWDPVPATCNHDKRLGGRSQCAFDTCCRYCQTLPPTWHALLDARGTLKPPSTQNVSPLADNHRRAPRKGRSWVASRRLAPLFNPGGSMAAMGWRLLDVPTSLDEECEASPPHGYLAETRPSLCFLLYFFLSFCPLVLAHPVAPYSVPSSPSRTSKRNMWRLEQATGTETCPRICLSLDILLSFRPRPSSFSHLSIPS